MSESIHIAMLLALVGGFLEAYTFISRDQVFANCQTGNLVLLAMNVFQGNFSHILLYAAPISAFILGVFLTEKIRTIFSFHPKIHWRQIMIFFEAVCLLVAAFVPLGKWDILVTTLISFVASMQTDSFRKLDGNIYASTMCTGNLRSGSKNLFDFIHGKDKEAGKRSLYYFMIVFVFMLGAVLGAGLTSVFMEKAAFFCCIVLVVIFFIMFIHTEQEKENMRQSYILREVKKARKRKK